MKTYIKNLLFFAVVIFSQMTARAQNEWPRLVTAPDGTRINIYQPQPESLTANELKFKSVISVQAANEQDPVFGMLWSVAEVSRDDARKSMTISSIKQANLKFSPEPDQTRNSYLRTILETSIPGTIGVLDIDQVQSSISRHGEEKKLAESFSNQVPEIIYSDHPAMLVLVDGEPKFQPNPEWGVDVLVNSPFTMARTSDNEYYLYGGNRWFVATAATGPFQPATNVPAGIQKIESTIKSTGNDDPSYSTVTGDPNETPEIIVRTHPAELLQTKGQPRLAPIEGTGLSYISNSDNDVFLNGGDQQYYLLIAGRWFRSPQLNGGWQYVPAGSLPGDFAHIPEGSPRDNVLASVPGTTASRDAVMDAQIPRIAKVDRNNASANVTYDGTPKFSDIPGTHMQYAENTSSTVVRYLDKYYVVENGVWFESYSPNGPWGVAVNRPAEIDIIPPSSPVYNMKYVYIYDVTPNWVYMGYTPGYLNAYVYGPTVVYGTGYYYRPWWGHHYYPHPYTWGFSFHYNPWYGWSMGFGFSTGWLNVGFGTGYWNGWAGGWWGPPVYHPPYHCYSNYGYYGNHYYNPHAYSYGYEANRHYTSNIYGYRRDVTTYGNGNVYGARNGFGPSRSPNAYVTPAMQRNSNSVFASNNGMSANGDRYNRPGNQAASGTGPSSVNGRQNAPQTSPQGNGRQYAPQSSPQYNGRQYSPRSESPYNGRQYTPQNSPGANGRQYSPRSESPYNGRQYAPQSSAGANGRHYSPRSESPYNGRQPQYRGGGQSNSRQYPSSGNASGPTRSQGQRSDYGHGGRGERR